MRIPGRTASMSLIAISCATSCAAPNSVPQNANPHGVSDRATSIVAGDRHTCVLLDSGRVACWGDNARGQLGVGDSVEHDGAVFVSALADVTSIHAAGNVSCAVQRDGVASCWGAGTLAPNPMAWLRRVVDVRVGQNGICVLDDTGRVACRSPGRDGERLRPVALVSGAVEVEAGDTVGCASTASGELWCWNMREPAVVHAVTPSPLHGLGASPRYVVLNADPWYFPGERGTPFESLRAVVCARSASGTVSCTRAAGRKAETLHDVASLAGRSNRACMLDVHGKLACWEYAVGCTEWGCAQEDVAAGEGEFLGLGELAVGRNHTCVLTPDGRRARCLGANDAGQLGYLVPPHEPEPHEVSGIDDATHLAVGASHACVVRGTRTVACWGNNERGQLGDGTTRAALVPVAVSQIADAIAVAAGEGHSCALRATGSVVCWGGGESQHLPSPVPGITDAVELSVGRDRACARRPDGSVFCWSTQAQGGLPARVHGVKQAAAVFAPGGDATCEREAQTAELRCWGAVPARVPECISVEEPWPGAAPCPLVLKPAVAQSGAVPFTLPFTRAAALLQAQGTWCARSDRGSVSCWDGCSGLGTDNPKIHVLSGMSDAVHVADGDGAICALTKRGGVVCVKAGVESGGGDECRPLSGRAEFVPLSDDVVQLEGGGGRTCARLLSGRVRCWGLRQSAPLGDGASVFHASAIEVEVVPRVGR